MSAKKKKEESERQQLQISMPRKGFGVIPGAKELKRCNVNEKRIADSNCLPGHSKTAVTFGINIVHLGEIQKEKKFHGSGCAQAAGKIRNWQLGATELCVRWANVCCWDLGSCSPEVQERA